MRQKETAMLASALRMAAKMNGEDARISEKTIDRQCVKEFVIQLDDIIDQYDAVLSLGCGAGVQAVADMFPEVPVIPALNTEFMGETKDQGYWVESCIGCGDCMLYYFGGICPLARCSKQLLNGPCGGSQRGICEVYADKETPCVWDQIYHRLKDLGQLEKLMEIEPAKGWHPSRDGGQRKIVREDLRL